MLNHLINPPPRVAILGTYIALYDTAYPGYRDRVGAFVDRIVEVLKPDISVESIGLCTDEASAREFIAQAEKNEVDAVILLSLGYTNSLTVVGPIAETELPILFFNTQEIETVEKNFSDEDLLRNHGMQGVQDLAAVLVRRGKRFGIVTGLIEQSDTRESLIDHLIATRAHRALRGTRVASMGPPMPGMGDAQFDRARFQEVFGVESVEIDPSLLAQKRAEVSEADLLASMELDEKHFEIDPGVGEEDHRRSSRLELGLRRLVEEEQFAGLTLSFDTISQTKGIETIPFFGITKLMGEGMSYGGEGDLFVTAAGAIAGRLCQEMCFTEIYTMDFKNNAVLNSHMAECNWRFARKDRKPKLVSRQFSLASSPPFLMAHFALEPGPVTLFDLAIDSEGGFRFILFECEVDDWPASEKLDRPNFKLKFKRDLREVMDEYSLLGGGHHLNLVYGSHSRRFEILADHCGVLCTRIANA